MIWEKEKTVRLIVKGEDMNITFNIPNAIEVEEIFALVRKEDVNTDSKVFEKLVTHVDGFSSASEFVKTPGTSKIIKIVSEKILESSDIPVELKNESSSSTV